MFPTNSTNEQLQIDTLGGLSIALIQVPGISGGDPPKRLHFDARTAEALLVYLACQARWLPRETLAELLWPERSHEQALANLRSSIHRLRLQLAQYLSTTRQAVALTPGTSVRVDAIELEAHLKAGRLVEGVVLYKGDFLDGFFVEGSPAFEQWALLERERLRNLVISAHQQLVTQKTAAGQHDAAIVQAERLLQLDPYHEPTHRQLMRLLAQAGQRSAAMAQYAACRQLLDRELGVPPDETTTALYDKIRSGTLNEAMQDQTAPSTHDNAAPQPRASVRSRQHALPLPSTPLIGREAELAQVANLLANPDCRLLSLLGLGGIGKTRLAMEAATRVMGSFTDGVYWVSLAPVATADFMLVAIAQSLGLQTASGDLPAQIAGYLRPRQLLLVLDNFEHLLNAAEFVAYLLHNAPELKVLVSSRERLYLLEEWLLPIAGLPVAEGLSGEAEQLFLRSAQRVRHGFTAQGQEEAIASICRQVEGMPLAIELAASWTRVMSCAEIAHQLALDPKLLTTVLRNLPERHRSLHGLLDHSWRLLSPAEQAVLRRLSVFRGGWIQAQAAEVAGATLPLLLSLVDKSLVRTTVQDRFDMHELVRQYASEQLIANGEYDVICRRHFEAYLQFMRTADSKLRGTEASIWYMQLEPEQDNLRTALQWALDQAHYADAAWLAVALHHFYYTRGYWHEGARSLEPLLTHRHTLGVDLHLATLLTLYNFWRSLEDFHSIDRYMHELVQLLEASSHQSLRAVGYRLIAVSTSDFTQATTVWEKCLLLARAAATSPRQGDLFCVFADGVYQLAFALIRYAIRLIDVGDLAQAARLSGEGLELLQMQGNRDFIAFGYGNLGRLALLRGEIGQARHLLQKAVTIAATVANRLALADWQPRLAIVLLYAGDAPAARRLLTESLSLCTGLRGDLVLGRVYTYLAEIALCEGNLNEAEQWLAQSVEHYAKPRWIRLELVECLWVAARLASAQRQFVRAATLFGLAERVGRQIQYVYTGPARTQADAALTTVRKQLAAGVFAEAFAAGQQISLDEAFVTLLLPIAVAGTRAAP